MSVRFTGVLRRSSTIVLRAARCRRSYGLCASGTWLSKRSSRACAASCTEQAWRWRTGTRASKSCRRRAAHTSSRRRACATSCARCNREPTSRASSSPLRDATCAPRNWTWRVSRCAAYTVQYSSQHCTSRSRAAAGEVRGARGEEHGDAAGAHRAHLAGTSDAAVGPRARDQPAARRTHLPARQPHATRRGDLLTHSHSHTRFILAQVLYLLARALHEAAQSLWRRLVRIGISVLDLQAEREAQADRGSRAATQLALITDTERLLGARFSSAIILRTRSLNSSTRTARSHASSHSQRVRVCVYSLYLQTVAVIPNPNLEPCSHLVLRVNSRSPPS